MIEALRQFFGNSGLEKKQAATRKRSNKPNGNKQSILLFLALALNVAALDYQSGTKFLSGTCLACKTGSYWQAVSDTSHKKRPGDCPMKPQSMELYIEAQWTTFFKIYLDTSKGYGQV